MKNDLFIKTGIVIPEHELDISTSRAGGPGGQHVNKSDTRITVRWNILQTNVLNEEQKQQLISKLQTKLTSEGDLIVHNSESRSQVQNKKLALQNLAEEICRALYVPKKRKATKITATAKESRLKSKMLRSAIKKNRHKKYYDD